MASTDLLYSDYFSFTFTAPDYSGEQIPESSSRVSLSPSNASPVPAEGARRRAFNPLRKRSKSDPVLHCRLLQGPKIDGCYLVQRQRIFIWTKGSGIDSLLPLVQSLQGNFDFFFFFH